MKHDLVFLNEERKEIRAIGYAFIDECDNTIIIVYGEGRRDAMSKYLSEDGDLLKIKYKYIDLCQKHVL